MQIPHICCCQFRVISLELKKKWEFNTFCIPPVEPHLNFANYLRNSLANQQNSINFNLISSVLFYLRCVAFGKIKSKTLIFLDNLI